MFRNVNAMYVFIERPDTAPDVPDNGPIELNFVATDAQQTQLTNIEPQFGNMTIMQTLEVRVSDDTAGAGNGVNGN